LTQGFCIYHYDFNGPHRERNWDIYRMRVKEKRTLDSIGSKYGVSRERVRQIVAKAERILARRAWADAEAARKREMVMAALNLSVGVLNILTNMGVAEMNLRDFVQQYTPNDVIREPNCGRRKLKQLIAAIEEIDPNVSNIWTAGHGQNYNPTKHGGRRAGEGDAPA
jgi:hypothetical protein